MRLPVVSSLIPVILLYLLLSGSIAANRCPAGQWSESNDLSTCKVCDTGYYCPSDTTIGYGTLYKACPHGTYCDTKGLTDPKECPPGTYQPDEGATSIQACLTCPTDTLYPMSGGYECYPCPNGYTCTDPARTPTPISTTSPSSYNASSTKISPTTKSPLTLLIVTLLSSTGKY